MTRFNTYRATVWNNLSGEILEVLEMERPRFTKRDLHNVVASLFFFAAQGCENRDIMAEVLRNGKSNVMRIGCGTKVDGAIIDADISINGVPFRRMNIAD